MSKANNNNNNNRSNLYSHFTTLKDALPEKEKQTVHKLFDQQGALSLCLRHWV